MHNSNQKPANLLRICLRVFQRFFEVPTPSERTWPTRRMRGFFAGSDVVKSQAALGARGSRTEWHNYCTNETALQRRRWLFNEVWLPVRPFSLAGSERIPSTISSNILTPDRLARTSSRVSICAKHLSACVLLSILVSACFVELSRNPNGVLVQGNWNSVREWLERNRE